MRIDFDSNPIRYFDMNGDEIFEGDKVLMDGRSWDVMLTEDGYLGVDSTNPKWIEQYRAAPGEFGVYPFEVTDDPVLLDT